MSLSEFLVLQYLMCGVWMQRTFGRGQRHVHALCTASLPLLPILGTLMAVAAALAALHMHSPSFESL